MNEEFMTLYNSVRDCPPEAQKEIKGGKLKGYTDINPMWRIKVLTEQFGVCGFGWYYDIVERWTETTQNDEVGAYVRINLYVKINGEWSQPIVGIGGNKLCGKGVGQEQNDEAWKMALTDAISVACKNLGMAADIYFAKDRTKYTADKEEEDKLEQELKLALKEIEDCKTKTDISQVWNKWYHKFGALTEFRNAVVLKNQQL